MSEFKVYLGLLGAGKTLLCVEREILKHLFNGEEVYSTTWLNWKHPNYHYFEEFDEVKNVRNAVIFFDEIGQVLEPRLWAKEDSGCRRFFQLHRHRHNDIYGTTQEVSLVAKSALIVVSDWYLCSNEQSFFNFGHLKIKRERLTLKDLRKPLDASDTEELFVSEEATPDLFPSKDEKIFYFTKKQLLHNGLKDDKIEQFHWYCEKCASRQSPKIQKGQKTCPKHKGEILIKRPSGLYDTDYDPMDII